jgi:Holliday junction DNA helicase RuvA
VIALYGFATLEERSLFEELMSVTGVGPRSALGFLSLFSPEGLREAIAEEDYVRLTKVPGIGRKTAQRVVLELKGKLERVGVPTARVPLSRQDQELLSVLTDSLGYTAAEAAEALRSGEVAAATNDEDRLRAAIRAIAGR